MLLKSYRLFIKTITLFLYKCYINKKEYKVLIISRYIYEDIIDFIEWIKCKPNSIDVIL